MSGKSEREDEMDIDIKEEYYQLASDGINYERIPDKYQSTMSQSTQDLPSSLRCRLCAIQNDDMIDIFAIHETKGNIAEKIKYCLRIVVNESDDLPKRICWFCSEKLELCYQFNKIVEEANRQFRASDKQTSVKLEETATDFGPPSRNSHCEALFDLSIDGTDSKSATIAEAVTTTGSTVKSNLVWTSSESFSEVSDPSETLRANNLITAEEEISSTDENQQVDLSTFDLSSGRTSALDVLQKTTGAPEVSTTSCHRPRPNEQTSTAQCEKGSEDQENLIVPGGTETTKRCSRCMSAGIETQVQVRREDLRLYARRLKKNKTGYLCFMCNKPFKHLSTLKLHMTVHSDERLWGCNYCKKSFKTKGHLHQHLTVCKKRPEANATINKYLAGATLFTQEAGLHIESPTIAEQYKEQSIGLNLRRNLFPACSEPSSGVFDTNENICVNNLTKDKKRSLSDNERQTLDSPMVNVNPGRPTTLVTVQQSHCDSKVSTMTCAKPQAHGKKTFSAGREKRTEDRELRSGRGKKFQI